MNFSQKGLWEKIRIAREKSVSHDTPTPSNPQTPKISIGFSSHFSSASTKGGGGEDFYKIPFQGGEVH